MRCCRELAGMVFAAMLLTLGKAPVLAGAEAVVLSVPHQGVAGNVWSNRTASGPSKAGAMEVLWVGRGGPEVRSAGQFVLQLPTRPEGTRLDRAEFQTILRLGRDRLVDTDLQLITLGLRREAVVGPRDFDAAAVMIQADLVAAGSMSSDYRGVELNAEGQTRLTAEIRAAYERQEAAGQYLVLQVRSAKTRSDPITEQESRQLLDVVRTRLVLHFEPGA